MPKKFGSNPKAESARERDAGRKQSADEARAKAKEDAEWQDDDRDAARKSARRTERDDKRMKETQWKQENRLLAAAEEAELDAAAKKAGGAAPRPKVTQANIAKIRQASETSVASSEAAVEPKAGSITLPEPLEENPNQAMAEILARENSSEARSVDAAIAALVLSPEHERVVDRYPERRYAAAMAAFEEENLPRIKKEYPSLRLTQWKVILQKEFKKSPRNPFNQIPPSPS